MFYTVTIKGPYHSAQYIYNSETEKTTAVYRLMDDAEETILPGYEQLDVQIVPNVDLQAEEYIRHREKWEVLSAKEDMIRTVIDTAEDPVTGEKYLAAQYALIDPIMEETALTDDTEMIITFLSKVPRNSFVRSLPVYDVARHVQRTFVSDMYNYNRQKKIPVKTFSPIIF